MFKKLILLLMVSGFLLNACGPRARPHRPVPRPKVIKAPAGCVKKVWVKGHKNQKGKWIPGYWRCHP